jgi:hypothetical protein
MDVIVTDSNGHDFGAPFALPAGAPPVEFTYSAPVSVNTTNTANVTATDILGGTVSGSDGATNLVISPDICIEKTVDCNNDGIFLHEDTGTAGDTAHWKVVVWNCGDSDLTNVIVTDSNGHDFGAPFNLPVGAPPVEFNYDTVVNVDTTNTANVTATDILGGTVSDSDSATNLVIKCNGCLKICKYEDKNGNGQKDYGEPYLSGWTFNVTDSQGHSQLVTTNGSGGTCGGGCGYSVTTSCGGGTCGGGCDYCVTICNLTAGEYTVTEILQAGWTCTTGNPREVTVECDKTATVNFGNQRPCSGCLKICKYEDKNGNGKKDYGESWLSGWTFNVTDSQGNSQLVTTGGSVGTYCGGYDYCVTICGLAPGEYTVTEIPQAGWTCTTGNPRTVTVVCCKTTTVSFGNQRPCSGCLKIYKYNDKNGNGRKDWGEPYLSGWTFDVTDSQGNSWSGTTNSYGYVTICNLAPGVYTVTEPLILAGWTCTTGNPREVIVVCGKTATVNFGNKQNK